MGWTRFLVHGVPVWGDDETISGPDTLLQEARMLPGLKKAIFAMQPRWLRPIEYITSPYSSITFAISDPDGSITSVLISDRAALFGKEVMVQKWIDKPALVQCSRCHALGHNKASKACPLGKDSVKCYLCGGTHRYEKHDQHCSRKHAVAGICDCTHFKCLSCQKTGHNCRDVRCPTRDLYRPRGNRRTEKASGKRRARPQRSPDSDGDLYGPLSLNAESARPIRPADRPTQHCLPLLTETTLDYERIDEYERMEEDRINYNLTNVVPGSNDPLADWNTDEQPTGWGSPTTPQHKAYTPSRPAGDANPLNLA